MKTAKKIVIYGICALLIATTSILGTLAYLTDSEDVTNTFTMGKVSITLDEAKVDENGQEDPSGARTIDGNAYKMIPGMTYFKDPTMTVENGSAEAYVRMLVKINCYNELQTIFGGQFLPQNFVKDWDDTVWVSTRTVNVDGNVATYEFRYKEAVKADTADVKLKPLFTEFTVPGELDGDDLATLNGFEIKVIGHAIQAGSFVDNAGNADVDAAWAAFDAQMAAANP